MKTITTNIKEKIFAQYFGAEYQYKNNFGTYKDNVEFGHNTSSHIGQGAVLRLKPLSKITDEDVTGVINMGMDEPYDQLEIESKDNDSVCFSFKPRRGGRISAILNYTELMFDSYQLLQSKGYAMPCLSYSVDDLVELGVYKLT